MTELKSSRNLRLLFWAEFVKKIQDIQQEQEKTILLQLI